MLSKYWATFVVTWQNSFVYRTSLFLWRMRQFLTTLMAVTIWNVIFTNQGTQFGYSQTEMINYIVVVNIIQSLVVATVLHGLAQLVWNGNISYELVKPMNLFGYLGMQDLADKLKNGLFVVLESAIIIAIFQPSIILPALGIFALTSAWILGGIAINFIIQLLFGAMGFYSPDTWGPRFIFFVLIEATAGRLFPLDILPKWLEQTLYFTPFPYLSYVQTQLFLGRLDSSQVWLFSGILITWIVFLAGICHWWWSNALKDYSAAGR